MVPHAESSTGVCAQVPAPSQVRHSAHLDALGTARANAAGDVVFAVAAVPDAQGSIDPDSFRLYRLTLGAADGPSAAPAFNALMPPNWFEVNAAGDFYVNYATSSMDPTMRSEEYPADGGSAFTVQGGVNRGVVTGKAGDPDENTFYIMAGGGGGESFEGTIRVVTRDGSSFVETPQVVNAGRCGHLLQRALPSRRRIYMFSDSAKSLALRDRRRGVHRQSNPDPARGGRPRPRPRQHQRHLPGRGPVGLHRGQRNRLQVRAPRRGLPAGHPVRRHHRRAALYLSTTGAIDSRGVRADTQEKVRGPVPADGTDVTITPAGVLDPGQVVVFTRNQLALRSPPATRSCT